MARKPDRRLAVDPERAAHVEIALGVDGAARDRDLERRRDRAQRHARARGERLQQHVAGARQLARAAGGRVEAGVDEGAAGVDAARDAALAEGALGAEDDHRGLGVLAVPALDRALDGPQLVSVHARDCRRSRRPHVSRRRRLGSAPPEGPRARWRQGHARSCTCDATRARVRDGPRPVRALGRRRDGHHLHRRRHRHRRLHRRRRPGHRRPARSPDRRRAARRRGLAHRRAGQLTAFAAWRRTARSRRSPATAPPSSRTTGARRRWRSINAPNDVAVRADGGILIADSNNNRVRLVRPDGTITTVAGTGSRATTATASRHVAQLNFPAGVAVDRRWRLPHRRQRQPPHPLRQPRRDDLHGRRQRHARRRRGRRAGDGGPDQRPGRRRRVRRTAHSPSPRSSATACASSAPRAHLHGRRHRCRRVQRRRRPGRRARSSTAPIGLAALPGGGSSSPIPATSASAASTAAPSSRRSPASAARGRRARAVRRPRRS